MIQGNSSENDTTSFMQKLLAKLLFWGQNGVSKDVGSAVKWYTKSAMELEDPAAMYEYSILLFKVSIMSCVSRGYRTSILPDMCCVCVD